MNPGPVPAPPTRTAVKILLACAVGLFAASSWLAHGGLRDPTFDVDTFDYAQMARQVYRGEGFTMLQTFPYVQRYLVERGFSPQPPWLNTTRFPLVAVQEAAAFSIVGPGDLGILLTGGALFVATAIVVFLLGHRLHGPWVGVVAALAMSAEAEQLRISRSGLLETGAGLFLVLAALALVVTTAERSRRMGSALALGSILGLAFLQRYDLLVLAPVAAALVFFRCSTWRGPGVLWTAAGFLLVAGPWFLRNLWTLGTLFGSTSIDRNLLGGMIPGDVYMGSQTLNPWQVALEHWPALLAKVEVGRSWMMDHAWELLGGELAAWAGVVVIVCPLLARTRRVRTAWLFLAGTFLLRAMLLTLMHHEVRFYRSFTPLVLALAAVTAASVLRTLSPRWARAAEPLAAMALTVIAVASLPGSPWAPLRIEPPGIFASLRDNTPAGTIVASDQSWHVAWYSDRPSIRFSGEWPELIGIEQLGVRIGAVLMRGPSGLAFDEAQRQTGRELFVRAPDFGRGYRLWIRKPGSAGLATQ